MEPVTTALTIAAFKKPIEDLCQGATGLIKGIGKKWQAAGIADSIVQRVEDLERVRTMFSNEPVALSSFYYPSKVHSAQHARSPMSVNSLTDLNKDGNVLIAGTLGQGKSMFMRHLCVQEAKTASSVPLFIELRGIDGENGIDSLLRNALQLLGFTDIDGTILAFLFLSGRFVVFADGYDEVKREFALQTQHDMTLLMNQYPATRWIVSTRPGSLADHLQTVPNLRHYYLTPLTEDDFSPFLENLKIPAEQRLRLLSEIKGSQTQVKGVLTTPLMLTLLVETFGSGAGIPNNLHDFYVSIFIVPVWRHDNLKPMFQRQRATSLSNGDLQDVFEAFAFLTKEFGVSLNDEQFAEASKNAARICNKEFHPEGLKNDLTDAVCLMMRDGLKTAFIHRSIQEFFAAFFVKHKSDHEIVKKIYTGLKGQKLVNWNQEIKFLEKIDHFRFLEYFRIPAIETTLQGLGYNSSQKIQITKTKFKSYFVLLNTQVIEVITGEKSTFIAMASVDSPVFNDQAMQLLSPLLDNRRSMVVAEEDLFIYKQSDNFKVMAWSRFWKIHPAQAEAALRRVKEACGRMEKELVKSRKIVDDRKQDISSIILGSIN